jgi:hypothetical protein
MGSAPEFEPNGGDHVQEPAGFVRPLRLSGDAVAFGNSFSSSQRSTGPLQLPVPNRHLSNGVQSSGIAPGPPPLRKDKEHVTGLQDTRIRADMGLSTNISPPASRGMASTAVRANSNSVSPTTTRFDRDAMQGYLRRNAALEEATQRFRNLNLSRSNPYDKYSQAQESARPCIYDEDLARYKNGYSDLYYGSYDPRLQDYSDQQTFGPWNQWGYQDVKPGYDQFIEYQNSPSSPYHASSLTPSSGTDSIRSAVASRNSYHEMVVPNRQSGLHEAYCRQPYVNNNKMMVPRGAMPVNIAQGRMNPHATPYYDIGYAMGYNGYPLRDEARLLQQRSAFLEEFRINKNTKRYELRDLFGYIVEFSGDQHGSRFIQHKLETANSDEKDQIFKEIHSDALQLMTDVFGNYVIQKLFEHGNQSQKKMLAKHMEGHVQYLSTQMYGCRVVQKALEHVLTDQQATIVKELDGLNKDVLKTIRDQNGNHVVQKAIERVPAEHIQFIIEAHRGEAVKLAQHTYGCRVIQRILEHCTPAAKRIILDELHGCIAPLITDQFGNYGKSVLRSSDDIR